MSAGGRRSPTYAWERSSQGKRPSLRGMERGKSDGGGIGNSEVGSGLVHRFQTESE